MQKDVTTLLSHKYPLGPLMATWPLSSMECLGGYCIRSAQFLFKESAPLDVLPKLYSWVRQQHQPTVEDWLQEHVASREKCSFFFLAKKTDFLNLGENPSPIHFHPVSPNSSPRFVKDCQSSTYVKNFEYTLQVWFP